MCILYIYVYAYIVYINIYVCKIKQNLIFNILDRVY